MSETASSPLTDAARRIEYSQLGSTPSIKPPATYAEGTPGDLPGPPRETTVPTGTAP
jgi:hypothetical protein